MNVLFLTITQFPSINARGIYTDLMREFRKQGHNVFVVNPIERKYKLPTSLRKSDGVTILNVRTFNLQKTNIIEKGIGTLAIENQFYKAIKNYLSEIQFDLILYSTPPITFTKVIRNIKKKDNSKSYLLLKDIFPQNAVDIGLMKKGSLLHKFFERKEKKLYEVSDFIGCMSPANINFILTNNKQIQSNKLEVCPNSIELTTLNPNIHAKEEVKYNYNIDPQSTIFIYGGNLGKPQGIDFLLEVLNSNNGKNDRFFFIVGNGTEYKKINNWFKQNNFSNAKLIEYLPKKEYDNLVQACDVGLIFLDPRFTIPNYPSRLLSYLEYKMPVLMAIDKNTDIGKIAEDNNYGFWTESGNLKEFNLLLDKFCNNKSLIEEMGENGYRFLENNYTVRISYDKIMKHFI